MKIILFSTWQCKLNVQYIVARYSEDIAWTQNAENVLIYNKGKSLGVQNEKALPNVGREAHTYLAHIISNYHSLADITVFTQARISDHGHLQDLKSLYQLVNDAGTIGFSKNFKIFGHNHTWFGRSFNLKIKNELAIRYKINPEDIVKIEFGNWFEKNFGEPYPRHLFVYENALFAVSKSMILSRPENFYKSFFDQLSHSSAPIEAHFLERSWFYIFNCHKLVEIAWGLMAFEFLSEFSSCYASYVINPRSLFLVDIFSGQMVSGDKNGENVQQINLYQSYFDLFRKYLNNPSISLYRGPSGHFLSLLPDAYLDFIYIDGDHSYKGVKIDIELARKKVKSGGFICGHDYTPQFPGVIQAVDEFCASYKVKLELTKEDKCPSYLIVN